MRNYRELVYSVLDELKMFSDDNVWETGHIVSALNKYPWVSRFAAPTGTR
jgi:hypothetical protein